MKSLLSTLVVTMLLAQLVTGSWYVRKCANKLGNCRKTCRNGELPTEPASGMCPKGKLCCVLDLKVSGQCGGTTKAPEGTPAKTSGGTQASTAASTT